MKRPWAIYGVYVGGHLEYIGLTVNVAARRAHHKKMRFAGEDFSVRVLRRAETLLEAERIERSLIERRQPPRNIEWRGLGRGKHILVNTVRANWRGDMIPVRLRIRPGMMMPDEARFVWLAGGHGSNAAAIAEMPGWTIERAYHTFGPRQ